VFVFESLIYETHFYQTWYDRYAIRGRYNAVLRFLTINVNVDVQIRDVRATPAPLTLRQLDPRQ